MSDEYSIIDADIVWFINRCQSDNKPASEYQIGRFVEKVSFNLGDNMTLSEAREIAYLGIDWGNE